MLSQPPLSPAVEPPAPLPPLAQPVAAEPAPEPEPIALEPEPDPNAPGMLERKLLQFGLVSMDQLGEAMREEAASGRPVAGILIERGWVSQEQIAQLLEPTPPPAAAPEPEPFPVPVPVVEFAPPPVAEPAPSFLAEVPQQPAAVPAPEPVPLEPPPPPPAPEPVAEVAPVLLAEPVVEIPEEETTPTPTLGTTSGLAFHLYIRLTTGERIDADRFNDLNAARAHAEELVKRLSSNSHTWPHFGGRYIRPEAIISIDVEAAPV